MSVLIRFKILLTLSGADPGILVGGGGPGQSDKKKSSDNVFFCLVLSVLYLSQMGKFEENYHSSRFQRGPTFSRGGGGGVPFAYSL